MNNLKSKKIYFGTSSWAFEGWQGNVYHKTYPKGTFKRNCLAEYWQDGRFATVGMDLFFYNPPAESLLKHYADQFLPDSNLKACCKVWQELTIYRFPNQTSWGKRKGQLNPNFLNVDIFIERILKVHEKVFKTQTGPFIFEFQYLKKNDKIVADFAADLDKFFARLPNEFEYSVEIRNANFLDPAYFAILRGHHVAHVFNQWSYMPAIREQLKFDSLTADFVVARILTPPGMAYDATVKTFSPYDRIIKRQPEIREDVIKLIETAVSTRKSAYLLINNRIEGCAPDTVKELLVMAEQRL
jgi:uncharacterized protein YecE (DUF72 family)